MEKHEEHYDTIIIGGGQAGLAMGHALRATGREFTILEAHRRLGDSWRKRWDSLMLFTTARDSSLPDFPFPAEASYLPSKGEMADYLEEYAREFDLPVQLDTPVHSLDRLGETYFVASDDRRFTANNVVVATGAFPTQRIPAFASELSDSILQLPSTDYQRPESLPGGSVLVVGAGSSGAEIALDLAGKRKVWLAGTYAGYVPRRLFGAINTFSLLRRTIFQVPTRTKLGGKIRQRFLGGGAPVVDLRQSDLVEAGVQLVGRVVGVRGGSPQLADGQTLDPEVIIWATGFIQDFSWINLPVFDDQGIPLHTEGVIEGEPGLYFIGLPFMIRGASGLISGVGEDAAHLARQIERRSAMPRVTPSVVLAAAR